MNKFGGAKHIQASFPKLQLCIHYTNIYLLIIESNEINLNIYYNKGFDFMQAHGLIQCFSTGTISPLGGW
jgi:hypothetical protein